MPELTARANPPLQGPVAIKTITFYVDVLLESEQIHTKMSFNVGVGSGNVEIWS